MKYLLLFAVLGVIWWSWKKGQMAAEAKTRRELPPENMVVCGHCGVHLPESDSLKDGDKAYCSEAHRLAAGDKR